MDQTIITFTLNSQPIPITLNLVLAFLVIGLIFRYQRKAADEYKKWASTRNPIAPSLKESKSPYDAMYDGTSGCLWSLGERMVVALLWLVVVDLVFAKGAFSADVLQVLFSGN